MSKYLLIVLLTGFCFGQNSTVLYISTNGSDEIGDGSETNPFATIQKGIDFSNGGDTILVAPGHFYENINWSTELYFLNDEHFNEKGANLLFNSVVKNIQKWK